MRYLLTVISVFCAVYLSGFSPALSALDAPSPRKAKVYLGAESVQVTLKGIFIIHDGKRVRVKSLYSDQNGSLYVYKNYFGNDSLKATKHCKRHGWHITSDGKCPICKQEASKR